MATSIQILHPSEEIICDQIYDSYDPRLLLSSISDSHNTLLSPSEYWSELFVNLKLSLIGFTLEQFHDFLDIVQRIASKLFPQ